MPEFSTQDFEYLLAKQNVTGVDYDPDGDTVSVWVSQKLSPDALAPQDNVARRENLPDGFDGDVDVRDVGYGDDRDGFDPAIVGGARLLLDGEPFASDEPLPDYDELVTEGTEAADRASRHRPVLSGVSEIHAASTAATGGVLARVTDPSAATWGDDIEQGDLVRTSNHHVYGHPINDCPVDGSQSVLQPSPYDGGGSADAVGTVAGYATLEDGTAVDAAARRMTTQDAPGHYNLDVATRDVFDGDYPDLKGQQVTKGGRTTGVTTASVQGVDATIRVSYGGDVGTVTLRHQIVTGDLSQGGDSGSPVFETGQGRYIGHLFAGSPRVTVVNRADYIEQELGVHLMPDETDTIDGDVSVEMKAPLLSLEAADAQDVPGPGDEVSVRVTVASNYKQDAYVELNGPVDSSRASIPASAFEASDDGGYRGFTETSVTAPETYSETFTIAIDGGHVLDG